MGLMASWGPPDGECRNPLKAGWEFPGSPVVRTLCVQCQVAGFSPWSGNYV